MVRDRLPEDPAAADVIKDAYAVRSKILHEGTTDADLGAKAQAVENVIRRLYAQILGHTPKVAA